MLPSFSTGVEGADFIASNYEMVNDQGFKYFKALMVETGNPVMVRIHFDTYMYPMSEEKASKLDTCGHALLLVGYNAKGFIVHDPWDQSKWGGTFGGKDKEISYELLSRMPTVNCCLGMVSHYAPFCGYLDYPRAAIHQDREINIVGKLELPGIFGITQDIYPIQQLIADLVIPKNMEIKSQSIDKSALPFYAGQSTSINYTIGTGPDVGSYPLTMNVEASLDLPAFSWEKNRLSETITLKTKLHRRIDIKDKEWLNKYGRE
ncbi:hypothetical protein AB833_14820 [Chromatiales bacterium (ex Bugula neritina AB1)]|nr:hypothetical protein AB833_14820 [Chromatiales bacterium (ex Bugula neritina AB1)]